MTLRSKLLIKNLGLIILATVILYPETVFGQAVLKHSYTFEDGTAKDVVGAAHGTIMGGAISKGVYMATANGHHISLPGEEIAINTYPSITVEMYLVDDPNTANAFHTMTSYFGNTVGSNGTDYFFTSLKSRAAVSCMNISTPWSAETGVTGPNMLDDGLSHHLVSVVNNEEIAFYIDGALVGTSPMSDNNKIHNLSNTFAYLCKSGYVNDLTWLGHVLEFNIYSGEMDAAMVALRANDFPNEEGTSDATLLDLMIDGVTVQGFTSSHLEYHVALPKNTTGVPVVTAVPKISTATAVVTDIAEVPGTASVLVTAEDGMTMNTYTIEFTFVPSKEASLADLTVDDITVEGFSSGTTSYNVALPTGTTTVPSVVATAADPVASVVVDAAETLPGTTTVKVTAEDGVTVIRYYLNFIFVLSTDARLSDLALDGTTVSGFAPAVTAYNVALPEGTTIVPSLGAATAHPNATYVLNDAASVPGVSNVVVTAEDGTSKKTYYVNFSLLVSSHPIKASSIMVYPTVSGGNFRVITGEGPHSIEIYGMTGLLISRLITHDTETTVTTPKAGVYILRIGNDEYMKSFRIIHSE